jgi:hypothetical protein
MKIVIIFLSIILIGVILAIFFFEGKSKINDTKKKMDNANENITNNLKEKYELMKDLASLVKKSLKKKDYLKDFNSLKVNNLTNYELDTELSNHLITFKNLKEDYKSLNNDKYNETLQKISLIDQELYANKRYFNKNNNKLIKDLKGYVKIVAKLLKINVKTSYEIKEPNE